MQWGELQSTSESRTVNDHPTISVCIPFYKGEAYALETLRSVLAQTRTDWELVLTDDASPDGTADVIERFIAETADPRIRFYRNPERLGMVGNWNKVICLARGRYVKMVCGDDYMRPDCLEKQGQALDENPSAALVASSRMVVSSNGRPLFARACYKKSGLYPGREAVRQGLLTGTNTIGDPVAVMFRAEFLKVGLFESSVVYCTDIDLWLRILLHGDLYFIAEPLAFYRIHKGSTGKALRDKTVEDFLHVVDRIEAASDLRFTRKERFLIAWQSRAKNWLRQAVYRLLADR